MQVLTRRTFLTSASVGAASVAGAAVLAACGETQVVEKVVTQEVVVEKIVTKEVMVEVPAAPAAPPQPAGDRITFSTDHAAGPRGKAMQWALRRFRDVRPDIRVNVLPATDITRMTIELAAGSGPQVALMAGRAYQALVRDGGYADISEVTAKEGVDMDNYWLIPEGHPGHHPYEGSILYWGDRLYGMPYQTHAPGWSYNLDMLEAAGVAFPSETGASYTWRDLEEMAQQLTDEDAGVWGMQESPDWVMSWGGTAYSAGWPWWYSEAFDRSNYDHPAFVETMQWLWDLTHEMKVNVAPALGAEVRGEFGNPFVAGKAAIHNGSMYYGPSGSVAQVGRRFTWSLGPAPAHPDHPDGIGRLHDDQAHYATNAAERAGTIEAAAVWMIFACGKEVSDRVGIDRGNMPPWRDTLDEAATLAAPPAGMEWWKWTMEQPRNHTLGQQANWLEWRDASYWNYINAQMLNGEMGVDEAITRSQQGGDDVMAKFNWEPKPVTQSNYYD